MAGTQVEKTALLVSDEEEGPGTSVVEGAGDVHVATAGRSKLDARRVGLLASLGILFLAGAFRAQLRKESSTHAEMDGTVEFLTKQSDLSLVNKACAANSKGTNLSYIASSSYPGVQGWPTVNGKAYAAISMCLTMVPSCNPSKLRGNPDVRSTYSVASSSSAASTYQALLNNWPMMLELMRHTNCSHQTFTETVAQLAVEVSHLKELGAYYQDYSRFVTRLGTEVQVSFQETFQMLMEESAEVTTTTVAPKTHKLIKAANFAAVMFTGVGEMLAVGSSVKAVTELGKSMMAIASFYSEEEAMVEEFSTSAPSTESTSAGAADDNLMDVVDLDALAYVEHMEATMQATLMLQRHMLSTNWGRLQSSMSIVKACPLTTDEILFALDRARPFIDWAALSVLIPSKYVIYWKRGCFAAKMIPTDNTSVGVKGPATVPGARVFWLGEVGRPEAVPPASFWNYLLRKGGPFQSYINPVYHTNYSTPKSASTGILSQCHYIQKTYFGSGGKSASDVPMLCNVFGVPWLVYSFADMPVTNNNGYQNAYQCNNADFCSQPVQNFNSFIWLPSKANDWRDQAAGLRGCCMPDLRISEIPGSCMFPVCDCATLAAQIFVITDYLHNPDLPFWWGRCSVRTYDGRSFEDSLSSTSDYLQTSLGASWHELWSKHSIFQQIEADFSLQGLKNHEAAIAQRFAAFKAYREKARDYIISHKSELGPEVAQLLGITYCTKHSQCSDTGSMMCFTTNTCQDGSSYPNGPNAKPLEMHKLVPCTQCAPVDGGPANCNHMSFAPHRRRSHEYCQCKCKEVGI